MPYSNTTILSAVVFAVSFCAPIMGAAQNATASEELGSSLEGRDAIDSLLWFGVEGGNLGSIAYAGGVTSLSGNIQESGYLLRYSAFAGEFVYSSGGQTIGLDGTAFDLMLGYNFVEPSYQVSLFAGLDYQNYSTEPAAPLNPIQGGFAGMKLQAEVGGATAPNVYSTFAASYSTVLDTYYAQAQSNVRFDNGLQVGPSITYLGSSQFQSRKGGINLSGIEIGEVNIVVSAGRQINYGADETSGNYLGISGSFFY